MSYFNNIFILILIISINCVVFIYITNIQQQNTQQNQYRLFNTITINNKKSLSEMNTISRIFIHADEKHLISNMIGLTFATLPILNSKGVTLLSNQINFGIFYLTSGYISSYGKELLYKYLIKLMKTNKEGYKNKYNCNYIFCGLINTPLSYTRGLYFDITNGPSYMALYLFDKSIEVGASGCIFAIIGAFIPFCLASNDNYKYISLIYIFYQMLLEFSLLPTNLDILREYQNNDEKIAHHSHITGFIFGIFVGIFTLNAVIKKLKLIIVHLILVILGLFVCYYFYFYYALSIS